MSIGMTARSVLAAILASLVLAGVTPAHAAVQVGMLTCRSPETAGYIVVSARAFSCVFFPSAGGPAQPYQGVVQRFGAQIGVSSNVTMGWAVFAATTHVGPGALTGTYVGVSGGAAVVIGGTANGLVGGANNAFSLQPVSLEGETGLNVVATVTGLDLQGVRPVRHHRRRYHH